MQIHITYNTAKRLKEFMGESAPNPMSYQYYSESGNVCRAGMGITKSAPPVYALHDLLSKPFLEVFKDKYGSATSISLAMKLTCDYHKGGLPAVESALLGMMNTEVEK